MAFSRMFSKPASVLCTTVLHHSAVTATRLCARMSMLYQIVYRIHPTKKALYVKTFPRRGNCDTETHSTLYNLTSCCSQQTVQVTGGCLQSGDCGGQTLVHAGAKSYTETDNEVKKPLYVLTLSSILVPVPVVCRWLPKVSPPCDHFATHQWRGVFEQ